MEVDMSNFKDENAELRAYVKELQDERKVLLNELAAMADQNHILQKKSTVGQHYHVPDGAW
jgi:hypothetical protein